MEKSQPDSTNANDTCFKILFERILDAQRGIGDEGSRWSVVVGPPGSYAAAENGSGS